MATRSLGTLTLDLVAKVGGFVQGMDKGARSAQENFDKIKRSSEDTRKAVVASLAGIGTIVFAQWVKEGAQASAELGKFASVANTTTTEFQKLAFASEAVGISGEKLADIYKDVNDKVGDYLQNGGGQLKDFFTNIAPLVGVTADQFKNLSGPEALGLYFSSLEKAKLSQADMTFYMEAIGNDATALIPLLKNNAEGFREWGDVAQRLGLIMSGETLQASQELSAAIYVMDKAGEGLRNQIGAALAPTMSSFAGILLETATNGAAAAQIADVIATAMKGLAAAGYGAYAAVQLVGKSIGALAAAYDAGTEGASWYEKIAPPLLIRRVAKNFDQVKAVVGAASEDLQADLMAQADVINKIMEAGPSAQGNSSEQIKKLASFLSAGGIQGGIAGRGGEQGKAAEKAKPYNESADVKLLDNLRQQYAQLQAQYDSIDSQTGKVKELGEAQKALVKWEQELADLKNKSSLTADQKSLLANSELLTAQYKRNAALEKEVELRKKAAEEAVKLRTFVDQLNSDLSNDQGDLNNALAGAGMSDKEVQRFQERFAIRKKYADQQKQLQEQFNTGDISKDLYDQETANLQSALEKRLAMQEDYYSKVNEQQADWGAGAEKAWANYAEHATDYNQQAYDAVSGTLGDLTDNLGDAFADMIMGTESVGDAFNELAASMVSSIVNAIAQMAAQWLVYQAVQLAVGKTTQASGATQMVANASATSVQAGLNAFSSTAAIPIVGPVAAPAAAAAAIAATAPMVASIASLSLAGMAHDGIDAVPETGTWLLQKGERVTTAQTSAKLDATLDRVSRDGGAMRSGPLVGSMVFPGVSNSKDAKEASATMARRLNGLVAGTGRYS
ncbi:phage tail tape measure protein [Pseudomonas oryzihabitans]|uniref:Phage tail tape measure protein n=1 Tax=Pseudomonas oryzihabitans TaxID=47885 RepID=A0A2Z5A914_9PSED|nr:phage tail tape measure protein [Pseudomonas oryzihabitans]AXA66753.1 phage tail tape measure protein [Pseudomonas oryzihabitans]